MIRWTLTHWPWYWGSLFGKNWLILSIVSTIPLRSLSIHMMNWRTEEKDGANRRWNMHQINQLQLWALTSRWSTDATTHNPTIVFKPNTIFMCLIGATSLGRSLYTFSIRSITLSKFFTSLFLTMEYTWAEATRIRHESSRLRGSRSISGNTKRSKTVRQHKHL